MKIEYPPGATLLDPDEIAGLIPNYLTKRAELNQLEGENIEKAYQWLGRSKKKEILSITFVMKLHSKMFDEVWKWAGKKRNSEKSIGIAPEKIVPQLNQLLKNVEFQIQNQSYPWDELAARFHHTLVKIHVFPNGNGRHARIITDLLLEQNDQTPFSWGANQSTSSIDVEGPIRKQYVASLRSADDGDISPLIKFVRS